MLKATDFTYDGVFSGVYGIQIASFDGSVVEETAYITPTLTMVKPSKSKQFYYLSSKYEEAPTFEFSILSEKPIPDSVQRSILVWLDNRKGFKPLIIHQPEFETYTYNCIFNVVSIIYHASRCVGFKLRATFDSPYHYELSKTVHETAQGEEKEVVIYNNSDIIDDYVYPTVTFKLGENGTGIEIYNNTDDPYHQRGFIFENLTPKTEVIVNNETKTIISRRRDDYFDKFNGLKWLRLVKGKNVLKVKIDGEVTITCPQYAKIRF